MGKTKTIKFDRSKESQAFGSALMGAFRDKLIEENPKSDDGRYVVDSGRDKGRLIEKCLDCGGQHYELEQLDECSGAVDSQSTLYCPKCLGPVSSEFNIEHVCNGEDRSYS